MESELMAITLRMVSIGDFFAESRMVLRYSRAVATGFSIKSCFLGSAVFTTSSERKCCGVRTNTMSTFGSSSRL